MEFHTLKICRDQLSDDSWIGYELLFGTCASTQGHPLF